MLDPADRSMPDEGNLESDAFGQHIVSQARTKIARHAHLRSHSIGIEFKEGRLVLMGHLPSFYLKQMLQTTLRGLAGVERIENRVIVVSSNGISSVNRFTS